jgi:hypothetical protein
MNNNVLVIVELEIRVLGIIDGLKKNKKLKGVVEIKIWGGRLWICRVNKN